MVSYDRARLGAYLKGMREKSNWTQLEVSTKLGYKSPQFISNIERGMSVVPLKTLAKMIHIYGTDVEDVVNIILDSQRRLLQSKLKKGR